MIIKSENMLKKIEQIHNEVGCTTHARKKIKEPEENEKKNEILRNSRRTKNIKKPKMLMSKKI